MSSASILLGVMMDLVVLSFDDLQLAMAKIMALHPAGLLSGSGRRAVDFTLTVGLAWYLDVPPVTPLSPPLETGNLGWCPSCGGKKRPGPRLQVARFSARPGCHRLTGAFNELSTEAAESPLATVTPVAAIGTVTPVPGPWCCHWQAEHQGGPRAARVCTRPAGAARRRPESRCRAGSAAAQRHWQAAARTALGDTMGTSRTHAPASDPRRVPFLVAASASS